MLQKNTGDWLVMIFSSVRFMSCRVRSVNLRHVHTLGVAYIPGASYQTATGKRRLHSSTDIIIEPRHEKTNALASDLVRHKPGCTATEGG